MIDNVRKLELDVKTTTESLTRNLGLIEESAKDQFEQIKDSINIKRQVEKHPTQMVGGAVVAGLLVGLMAFRQSVSNQYCTRGLAQLLGTELRSELDLAKKVLLGIALTKGSEALGRVMPKWNAQIQDICDSATTKLASENRAPRT